MFQAWVTGRVVLPLSRAGVRTELNEGVGRKLATQYIDLDGLPEPKNDVKMTVKDAIWDLGKGWDW